MRVFRWRAIVPLALLVGMLAVAWLLLLDGLVERAVEEVGAEILGARVDVASADLDLGRGRVSLVGVQAANPSSPMHNLFEADEFVADIRVLPLLSKKVVIQQATVRGVRFGTERSTSGALENPSPNSGRLARLISAWANRVRVPPLSLEGLGAVVNVNAIARDSLRTLTQARRTTAFADSVRGVWETELERLDPASLIDSARSLVERLSEASPLRLGVAGVTRLVGSARSTLASIDALRSEAASLDSTVRSGVGALGRNVEALAAARQADYRYARSLLHLPSLDAPDVSPSIFGRMAIARLEPVLYWVNQVAEYLPPGLDPRRFPGPKRARRSGTTVSFPGTKAYPGFLLELAELDLTIGGSGAAAGRYTARIAGLTSQPALYGKPLSASIERTGAAAGPTDVRVSALLDHTGPVIRDSAVVSLRGLPLPDIDLGALGLRLSMGRGSSELSLLRTGDSVAGRWVWSSSDVTWSKTGERGAGSGNREAGAAAGVGQLAQDFLWRTVSSIDEVVIDVRFSGSAAGPTLRIGSNVGRAIARSLERQLGREIERAEQRVRAQVDRLVDQGVSEARTRVDALQSEVERRLGMRLDELTNVRQELEQALRRLLGTD